MTTKIITGDARAALAEARIRNDAPMFAEVTS